MNDNEEKAFRIAYRFYRKWRETVIETEEQWTELAADVSAMAPEFEKCPLAFHLVNAALEALNDLYRGGMKPVPAGYFGRDDL